MTPKQRVLQEIAVIPWFEDAGRPLDDESTARIATWDEWPGPDSKDAEQVSLDLQVVHDDLEQRSPAVCASWNTCLQSAVDRIAPSSPGFDVAEDAWHAPTAAAWHAAWVITLYVLLGEARLPIPAVVADQLDWFRRGRWPASYAERAEGEVRRSYVVL